MIESAAVGVPMAETVAKATVLESNPDRVVLGVPRTGYRIHLVPRRPVTTPAGRRVRGRVDVVARRIDVSRTGGNFIDPVYGEPRNVQGRVIAIAPHKGTIVVHAVVPMHVRVRAPQRPEDFELGQLVTFAVESGAGFTPLEESGVATPTAPELITSSEGVGPRDVKGDHGR